MIKTEISLAYDKYFDMVYRICFVYFGGNHADSEDMVHKVFLKYIEADKKFESDEHEKAWFICVTQNTCKSGLKRFFRKNVSLNNIKEKSTEMKTSETMNAILSLPKNEK